MALPVSQQNAKKLAECARQSTEGLATWGYLGLLATSGLRSNEFK